MIAGIPSAYVPKDLKNKQKNTSWNWGPWTKEFPQRISFVLSSANGGKLVGLGSNFEFLDPRIQTTNPKPPMNH